MDLGRKVMKSMPSGDFLPSPKEGECLPVEKDEMARSAFGNYSPPIRFNCLFEQGTGGLEGLIGLPA